MDSRSSMGRVVVATGLVLISVWSGVVSLLFRGWVVGFWLASFSVRLFCFVWLLGDLVIW
jgi:hypothetical protein